MKKTTISANASDPAVEVDISHAHLNEAEAALAAIRFGRIETLAAMKADASDYMMKTSLARLVLAMEWEMKELKIRAANQMAQEALTDSEERFRQMAENIRDVFFLRDADGDRMLYVSPAYEEVWGRSCESLYSNPKSWTEAIHQDDRTSTDEKCKQGISAGKAEFEFRLVRPDGSMRLIEMRALFRSATTLALTKKIVEFQGGHIGVQSEPGKGSVFTVVLPVMTGEGQTA